MRAAIITLSILLIASAVSSQDPGFATATRSLNDAFGSNDFEQANRIIDDLQRRITDAQLRHAIAQDDTAGVTAALAAGADPNLTDATGGSLLAAVAARCVGREDIVELLLAGGADPARGHFAGATVFEVAADSPHGCAHVLVRQGVEVDFTSPRAVRALISAIRSGDLEAVTLLLDGGVDVDAVDGRHDDWSLLMHAVDVEQEQIALILLERGVNGSAVLASAQAAGLETLASRLAQVLELAGTDESESRQRKQTKK